MQLRTDDGRIHLFRKDGDRIRPATTQADWSNYHGQFNGNRYSTLTQVNKSNVSRLAPKWIYSVPNAGRLQTTPIVHEGVI